MFTSKTTDEDINQKLNRVSSAYELSSVMDPTSSVLAPSTESSQFKESIFPSTMYNDDLYSDRSLLMKQQTRLVMGQGISNNAGIPMNLITKIPSYQWNFKHEDDKKSYHYGHHSHHKQKHILSELGSESVSSLGATSFNSSALNSLLIRLPLKAKTDRALKRSILNGLPLYDKDIASKEIRYMNLKKAELKLTGANTSIFSDTLNKTIDDTEYLHGEVIVNSFLTNKRIMRNYQWLVYYLRKMGGKKLETNPDINQGSHKVLSVRRASEFKMFLQKRHEKYVNYQRMRAQIVERRKSREHERQELAESRESRIMKLNSKGTNKSNVVDDDKAFGEFFSTSDIIDDTQDNKKSSDSGKVKKEKDSKLHEKATAPLTKEEEATLTKEKEEEEKDATLESTVPEFEDEVVVDDEELGENDKSDEALSANHEIIIEKEFSTEDEDLQNIQRRLFGMSSAARLEQQVKEANGIIKTKRVLYRRIPNSNSLGYCNIRRRKPSYL